VPADLDAEMLSNMVASSLQIDLLEQQELLAEPKTAGLLKRECAVLARLLVK
jgi:hypothetical protein